MPGLLVFPTLEEAVRAGFTIYDRLAGGGYLVRKRTEAGWQMALVDEKCRRV